MTEPAQPVPAETAVLGARLVPQGATFALWAPRATRVELALVDKDRRQANHDMDLSADGVWRVTVAGVEAGQRYGYRVHGPWNPSEGQRFNPAKLLLDPYARAITGGVDYAGPIFDHTAESNFLPDTTDSFAAVPLSVVVEQPTPPRPLARQLTAEELVVYELHVKGYTRLHPAVPEHLRGTYAGLAYPAVIEHLVGLGVNAVELLPIHHFISEPFVHGRGLSNYWGYNTLGYFAPHAAYSSQGTLGEQVDEFISMVDAYHKAGIAVLLDVVYNHTGEGGHDGPTLSFRGIDHGAYYRLTGDRRNDYDVTGCGNAVDSSHPVTRELILDSLRYWAEDLGVDGFRFDLATTLIRDQLHHVDQQHQIKHAIADDPVLSKRIMIAEPWDLGPYGYQVGSWGQGWSEWNDRYRGFTRDFWRGASQGVQELATRLCGSSDIFAGSGRPPTASVNFVTAHDGFTMRDLVTYDLKHNEANAERNRDGTDDNRSWNHGDEGETTDLQINAARRRSARNLMATLLLSAGIPMITAGDELGRTQAGNNNAYCQDSPVSWVNWTETWDDQLNLTRTLLALRAAHPVLRPTSYSRTLPVSDSGQDRPAVAWFAETGTQMSIAQWHETGRNTLGLYVNDETDTFLILVHAGFEPIGFTLPEAPFLADATVAAHTGVEGDLPTTPLQAGEVLSLPGRTIAVLSLTRPAPGAGSAAAAEARKPDIEA